MTRDESGKLVGRFVTRDESGKFVGIRIPTSWPEPFFSYRGRVISKISIPAWDQETILNISVSDEDFDKEAFNYFKRNLTKEESERRPRKNSNDNSNL